MHILAGKTRLGAVAIFLELALHITACAQNSTPQSPQAPSTAPLTDRTPGATGSAGRPAYLQLRYDEDWSFLRDESKRSDPLDCIKYIPLGRENWYVTLGGELRLYYENFRNETWGSEPADDNGFWLQRLMLHADWHLGERVRIFAQLKSGEIEDRVGGARPPDRDDMDVHQLFVDYSFSTEKSRSLTLRVGRQEMSFGSSRLIGFREGPNIRLSFDGVRLLGKYKRWTIDGFAVKPVEVDPGFFDDAPIHGQSLWGVYAVRPLRVIADDGKVDVYYFGLDKKQAHFNQGTARERRHTVGTRVWKSSQPLDYNYEFVYQFGSFGKGRINAWSVASDTGYTFEGARLRPRLGLKADVTSGDKNPNDPDLQTFNALFPKGAYFGELSPVGPYNHMDLHPAINLKLRKQVELLAEWLWYWRTSTRDGLYGVPGNLERTGNTSRERFIGQSFYTGLHIDLNRHTTLDTVFARFLVGAFLRDVPPARDTSYFSAWMTYKF
jgi:Alginate export